MGKLHQAAKDVFEYFKEIQVNGEIRGITLSAISRHLRIKSIQQVIGFLEKNGILEVIRNNRKHGNSYRLTGIEPDFSTLHMESSKTSKPGSSAKRKLAVDYNRDLTIRQESEVMKVRAKLRSIMKEMEISGGLHSPSYKSLEKAVQVLDMTLGKSMPLENQQTELKQQLKKDLPAETQSEKQAKQGRQHQQKATQIHNFTGYNY